MNLFLTIFLTLFVSHIVAALIGNAIYTRAQDRRDRRQAATQRRINEASHGPTDL
jgi:hypothetical protein